MVREIKETDWKLLRRLHPVALERFCQQVIEEINQATSNCTEDFHERYLEVFRLIKKRDKELGCAFNDMRRSNAIILLANIMESDLLTAEEFSQFSQETRESVEVVINIRRT